MGHLTIPLFIFVFGVVAGGIAHALLRRFWAAASVAGAAAAIAFVGGCYVFFIIAAPSELGPPLVGPLLLILGTAFAGALLGAGGVRLLGPH
jgi:hypothetical protein